MDVVQQSPSDAELIISDCGEIAGTVEAYDLYGTTLWRAENYFSETKRYTNRAEAIAWLMYGMT